MGGGGGEGEEYRKEKKTIFETLVLFGAHCLARRHCELFLSNSFYVHFIIFIFFYCNE
jgi:hypothetical protein